MGITIGGKMEWSPRVTVRGTDSIRSTADFQSRPQDPVEVVTSIAGESQVPTFLGAEMNTSGVVGLGDVSMLILATGRKDDKSLAGRTVSASNVIGLFRSTSSLAEAEREILITAAEVQKQEASVLPMKVKRVSQLKEST
jgi:hypothetical protein